MRHTISVPESSISNASNYDRSLPKEEDILSYVRLYLQRSIPGQEQVVRNNNTCTDPVYDTLPANLDKNIMSWDTYNLLTSFSTTPPIEWNDHLPIAMQNLTSRERWKIYPEILQYADILNTVSWAREEVWHPNSATDTKAACSSIRSMIERCCMYGHERIIGELGSKGYIDKRGERDLMKEIQLRKIQYPSSRIIAVVGSSIRDYLRAIYDDTAADVFDCELATSWKIASNQSFVIATDQIKTSYQYVYQHDIVRVPRRWQVSIAIIQNLGVWVADRKTTSTVIQETDDERPMEIE